MSKSPKKKQLFIKNNLKTKLRALIAALMVAVVGVTMLFNSQAATCVAPTNYPPPPNGAMTYVNSTFNQRVSSIQHQIEIYNDPGVGSNLFLQLYDFPVDETGQYFGLQTTGIAIFSRFGTIDQSNIRTANGSFATYGTNEGPYISLRKNYGSLPVGHYITRVVRAEYDGTGDWFNYYITFPGRGEEYIGGIRFPRLNTTVPATFSDGGGTWTEYWPNNNSTTLYPVPRWHVAVASIANGNKAPFRATSGYSAMPNSDIYLGTVGGEVHHELGDNTPRCTPAGTLWDNYTGPPPIIDTIPPPTASDAVLPTVVISQPTQDAALTSPVYISASATDNVGVVNMEILVNGTVVKTANGSSISTTWQPANSKRRPKNRQYTVTVRAKDAAGNTGTQSRTFYLR